ncbi:ADP-ribosyl cyclase/cyclic ADP-ribose hydrolase-like [Ptychodera flava]|uniref:ADP-ribosyl cyclase/cyclic ADP-ribose hydrolase-like n=1 Tax=Ptychodera flava TaxID=63121 RepID=UPI00396A2FC3
MIRDKNCTELWGLFHNSFAYRDPCDVSVDQFEEFMIAVSHDHPVDSTLFWDGWDVYSAVRQYGFQGRRKTDLDITLPGYMITSLSFCGSKTDPSGMNMSVCPAAGECAFGIGSLEAFWAKASYNFAEHARGTAGVFFNSNRPGGSFYLNNSFFTEFELKTLTKEDVSRFEITLITFLNEKPGDTCSSDNIQQLKQILVSKEIPHTCHENPREVLHMLCIDDVDNENCVGLLTSRSHRPITTVLSSSIIVTWIYIVFQLNSSSDFLPM